MSQSPGSGKSLRDRLNAASPEASEPNAAPPPPGGERPVETKADPRWAVPEPATNPAAERPRPTALPSSASLPSWSYAAGGFTVVLILVFIVARATGHSGSAPSVNPPGVVVQTPPSEDPAIQAQREAARAQMQVAMRAIHQSKTELDALVSSLRTGGSDTKPRLLTGINEVATSVEKLDTSNCPEDFRKPYKLYCQSIHNLHDAFKDLDDAPGLLANALAGFADGFLQNGGKFSGQNTDEETRLNNGMRDAIAAVRSSYNATDASAFDHHVSVDQ